MIFSRSTQYAIQALVLMAGQPDGTFLQSRVLADRLKLPMPYLGKIMMRFTQAGLLDSCRGRLGGYRLNQPPGRISLRQVVEIMSSGRVSRECLLGLKCCSDDDACALHCQWQPLKNHVFALLEEQSLEQLAQGVANGRYRLSELNVQSLSNLALPSGCAAKGCA